MKDLLSFEVPVPPLDEQRRIVAKLDAAVVRLRSVAKSCRDVHSLVLAAEKALLDRAFRDGFPS
ncbi:MAG: hypothetical protein KatS3mg014_1088 [Actinomycetota bacterium]|nr:MAG: hypothetical protein KatS3mg014_1088 [Actinomycetota bacterium]